MRATLSGHRAYRGIDRRNRAGPGRESIESLFLGWLALILVGGVVTILTVGKPFPRYLDAQGLAGVVRAVVSALAVVVGTMYLIRFRLVGEARAAWMGVAMVVLGLVPLGLVGLVPALDTSGAAERVLAWLRPASLLTVLGLLVVGARSAEINARLRPLRVLIASLSVVAALTVVLQLLPWLARSVSTPADGLAGVRGAGLGWVLASVVWCGAAAAYAHYGLRSHRWLYVSFGLVLIALFLAELARATPGSDTGSVVGRDLLRLLGVILALDGVVRELQRAHAQQDERLLRSVAAARLAEARLAAQREAREELAHQARSALSAIEGAVRTLERHKHALDPDTRASLEAAVSAEIANLQRLISARPADGEPAAFAVAEVLTPLVAVERLYGSRVMSLVPADLRVGCSPSVATEILQTLLENARRHAPHSPIEVTAARDGEWVVVRVDDRGPGIPAGLRTRIFQRGVRGPSAGVGSGLGLYVASQRAEEAGGRLWAEARRGGGASFFWAVPAESVSLNSRTGTDSIEEPGQVGHVVDPHAAAAPTDLHHRDPGAPEGVWEPDDDLGADVGRQ
ncbi:MAG: sensor histidine kinase [Acidimicrobiia bacterium]